MKKIPKKFLKEIKQTKELKGRFIIPDSYKIIEEFKGEVTDKNISFPKDLGAEHPFEFEDAETLYKKYGLVSGIVNRITESIVADFSIKLKNRNAQALIDDMIYNTNFISNLKDWVKEAVLKGNGFIEIDLNKPDIRVMNSNNIYVRRDSKSKVIEYTQYLGKMSIFNSKKIVKFKPNQIAHLLFNKIPNDPYGIGYIWPNEKTLGNLAKSEEDWHTIIKRKAGAPYHAKVGVPGEQVSSDVVDDVKTSLQYLTNKTEWVTDANVDIKMLDSPSLGEHHSNIAMYDFRMLLAGIGIPEVLLGSGQLNEGIAKVQQESYSRFIKSLQLTVQETIEEKIIKPLLRANGLDERPLFVWELPSEEEVNLRIDKISNLLKMGMTISPIMQTALERELANLFDLEEVKNFLPSLKDIQKEDGERKNAEREAEKEIPQPEVPGAKPTANQMLKESPEITIKEWINFQEIPGFNYLDYITFILKFLNKYKFNDLAAQTEQDLKDGKLSTKNIEKLRIIFKEGFKNNKTINQMERDVKDSLNLEPNRIEKIVRTESVKIANEGLLNMYDQNGIKKVRFLAAFSDRTCSICEGLNGQTFNINEMQVGINQPPIHPLCRCSTIALLE